MPNFFFYNLKEDTSDSAYEERHKDFEIKEKEEHKKFLMLSQKTKKKKNKIDYSNFPDIFFVQHSNLMSGQMTFLENDSKYTSSGRSKNPTSGTKSRTRAKTRKTSNFSKKTKKDEAIFFDEVSFLISSILSI